MDKLSSLDAVLVTPLQRISNPKGDILHALKRSDPGFLDFGEAYFTTVHQGDIKGWKKHTRMQMNLIVPIGQVCFYIHDEFVQRTTRYLVGAQHYVRLTVPPGYWVAFEGLSGELNLILNVADLEHDPAEAINAPLESYPLGAAT